MTDNDWSSNFDVTRDDLKRLVDWISEQKRGVTLEEITRRIIRGRVRFGRDVSPSALPQWVQEKHVLSWDEQEKWCEGCQVLVAKTVEKKVIPAFGIIVKITSDTYYVSIHDEIQKYNREPIGSQKSKNYYEYVRQLIWSQEQARTSNIEEQINLVLLKQGAEIASRISSALDRDPRFTIYKNFWYLQSWVQEISREKLQQVHRQLLKTAKQVTLAKMRELISGLPQGDIGEIAIIRALSKVPDLFQPFDGGWDVVKPPPPPWERAIGVYYVYDPKTYEIILKPGERLKKKIADRLKELGFYADVVEESKA